MGTMMPDDGDVRTEYVDGELLQSGEQARVMKELPNGKGWKDLGIKTAFGPIVVGHRMMFTGRARGEDLDTSGIVSATYDGEDIVVMTHRSRYKLEVKRAPPKERRETDFTPMGIAKGIGQMIQDALRGY